MLFIPNISLIHFFLFSVACLIRTSFYKIVFSKGAKFTQDIIVYDPFLN